MKVEHQNVLLVYLRTLKFVTLLWVILSGLLLIVPLWRRGCRTKLCCAPFTGILLRCIFYHCVAVALVFARSLLCCSTATLILSRNCKGDIKKYQVLTSADVHSTFAGFAAYSLCLSLPGFSSKKQQH